MIKKRFPAMLGAIALAASAVAQPTSVTWTTLGNTSDAHGEYFVQRLTVKGDLNFKRLGFNMTVRGMKALNPADTVVEICPGYYYIGSSRLNSGADSINIDIRTSGVLRKCSDAPDGVHRVNLDGSTTPVKYQRLPFTQYKQWANAKSDGMPYGPKIYDINEALKTDWTPSMFDIIPSFKKSHPHRRRSPAWQTGVREYQPRKSRLLPRNNQGRQLCARVPQRPHTRHCYPPV
jgi:hypothetical protein